jgi:hypothetical protein
MPKFRKKPVVIEAIQYQDTNEAYESVCAFAPGVHFEPAGFGRIVVSTLEGDVYASPGDYIIRGIKGELYPCKPDIFEATYEQVEQPMADDDLLSEQDDVYPKPEPVAWAVRDSFTIERARFTDLDEAAAHVVAEFKRTIHHRNPGAMTIVPVYEAAKESP